MKPKELWINVRDYAGVYGIAYDSNDPGFSDVDNSELVHVIEHSQPVSN